MVIKLNKKIEVIKLDNDLQLPLELENKIKSFWNEQLKDNPHLFNGEIWSVVGFEELLDRIIISIQKTNYAHYLYDERVSIEGKYGCYNLNCGILLETKDGYYVVGEMSKNTSYARGLQISGGNLDDNDIKQDGQVDVVNTVKRELKEELNIDLYDVDIVKQYEMKYMEIPTGRRHSYAPMMKGILTITAKQMEEQYNNYKKQLEELGEEVEFERLHFLKKENALEELAKLDNPKRPYIEALIGLDSKNKTN